MCLPFTSSVSRCLADDMFVHANADIRLPWNENALKPAAKRSRVYTPTTRSSTSYQLCWPRACYPFSLRRHPLSLQVPSSRNINPGRSMSHVHCSQGRLARSVALHHATTPLSSRTSVALRHLGCVMPLSNDLVTTTYVSVLGLVNSRSSTYSSRRRAALG